MLEGDEQAASLKQVKSARICVELDLSQHLKNVFWIGDEEELAFIVV